MRTDAPPYRREPDCTTSPAPPVVDGLFAGISILGAISLYDSSGEEAERARTQAKLIGIVGVAYAASAVVGFRRIAICRDAKNAWALTR